MSERLDLAREPLGAGARLHADARRSGRLKKAQQGVAPEFRLLDWLLGGIQADDVEYVLATSTP
jgi:hypothetical protein